MSKLIFDLHWLPRRTKNIMIKVNKPKSVKYSVIFIQKE